MSRDRNFEMLVVLGRIVGCLDRRLMRWACFVMFVMLSVADRIVVLLLSIG